MSGSTSVNIGAIFGLIVGGLLGFWAGTGYGKGEVLRKAGTKWGACYGNATCNVGSGCVEDKYCVPVFDAGVSQ